MGIHSFSELQKKYFPNCIDYIPLSLFSGKRIAMDMGVFMYANFSIAVSRVVDATNLAIEKPDMSKIYTLAIEICLSKINLFLSYNIVPVCCFDSKPHELKHAMKEKTNEKAELQISLENIQEIIAASDILLVSPSDLQEYGKLLKKTIRIDSTFVSQFTAVLTEMTIPQIHAKDLGLMSNDAEAICAVLCMPGNDYCVATYTDDTDIHAYGCNYSILEIESRKENRETVHYAKVRSLSKILYESKLNFSQFVDLCILMGNDFNNNLYNHGPKKNYDLIVQHQTLENISKIKDLATIPYIDVRKMYACTIVKITLNLPEKILFQRKT